MWPHMWMECRDADDWQFGKAKLMWKNELILLMINDFFNVCHCLH